MKTRNFVNMLILLSLACLQIYFIRTNIFAETPLVVHLFFTILYLYTIWNIPRREDCYICGVEYKIYCFRECKSRRMMYFGRTDVCWECLKDAEHSKEYIPQKSINNPNQDASRNRPTSH